VTSALFWCDIGRSSENPVVHAPAKLAVMLPMVRKKVRTLVAVGSRRYTFLSEI